MSTIFQVLSNLKFNGDNITAGEFIEGEIAEFEALVKDGVLRIIEGAESLEHAAKIVAGEAVAKAKEIAAAPIPPENTWGPKKDEPKESEASVDAGVTGVGDADADKKDVIVPPGEAGTGDQAPIKTPIDNGDNL